jgi:hypothetical protein
MKIDASTTSGPPIHYKSQIETDWIGQWDLYSKKDGKPIDVVLVIESVEPYQPLQRKTVKRADGSRGPERLNKFAIAFVGQKKRWISGPSTQQVIAGIYGPDLRKWIGKKIALYPDPNVTFGSTKVGGVRVRPTAPGTAPVTEDELDAAVDTDAQARIDAARDGS